MNAKKTVSMTLLIVLCSAFFLFSYAAEREGCVVCGMYLDLYEITRYELRFKDGTSQSTCSLACAAGLIRDNRKKIKTIRVADFLTGKLIDADKALILEGSDIPGVMSYTSRVAFPSREAALSMQKEHGGKIITFDEALENQLRDKE